jgi:hypothetical protein
VRIFGSLSRPVGFRPPHTISVVVSWLYSRLFRHMAVRHWRLPRAPWRNLPKTRLCRHNGIPSGLSSSRRYESAILRPPTCSWEARENRCHFSSKTTRDGVSSKVTQHLSRFCSKPGNHARSPRDNNAPFSRSPGVCPLAV